MFPLYSASKKKLQNLEIMECCEQLVGVYDYYNIYFMNYD